MKDRHKEMRELALKRDKLKALTLLMACPVYHSRIEWAYAIPHVFSKKVSQISN